MSREVHVRFCERPRVKFLRPTHPYIPIGRGFLYLVAIMDWCSRMVLAWQLSNTMDVSFCVAALEQALARFGKPEIFNTDQGSQFTSGEFTGALAAAGVRISMDGRGRWMDNIFIERLWRSLNTRRSICKDTPTVSRRGLGSPDGSAFTICDVHIRRSAIRRQ
jgi:transposase InsO family protein